MCTVFPSSAFVLLLEHTAKQQSAELKLYLTTRGGTFGGEIIFRDELLCLLLETTMASFRPPFPCESACFGARPSVGIVVVVLVVLEWHLMGLAH